jgi:predicted phosphohydrolase
VRAVVLSDTHNCHGRIDVPDGDLLLHAGDMTGHGGLYELEPFAEFLGGLPHRWKVLVAGNHDFCLENPTERETARAFLADFVYLEDAAVEIDGVRIYGSPWQPAFFDWAFNLPRGAALREKWARIPDDTEVLLTHTPPAGVLDETRRGEGVGCADLLDRIREVRPGLHVFGHIHEAYGTLRRDGVLYVNGSNCTVGYEPTNAPVVLDRKDGAWEVVGDTRN